MVSLSVKIFKIINKTIFYGVMNKKGNENRTEMKALTREC